eukprot:13133215-Heterocapsa_arctica.AAC.1
MAASTSAAWPSWGGRAAGPAELAAAHAEPQWRHKASRACSNSRCKAAGPLRRQSLQQLTLSKLSLGGFTTPAELAAAHAA